MKLLALALLLSVDTPTPAPDTNSIVERAEALGVPMGRMSIFSAL